MLNQSMISCPIFEFRGQLVIFIVTLLRPWSAMYPMFREVCRTILPISTFHLIA